MNEEVKKPNQNKLFLVIIASALIIGVFVFLGLYLSGSSDGASITGGAVAEGEKLVTKIIDGDTVIIEGGYSVRLLGMDTDEKGYPCYASAKQRLEELVLNKEVYLEADAEDKDQYQRYLRYLILDGENINQKMVEEGLAIARFYPENVKYKEEIIAAEKEARENKMGCKWGETIIQQTIEIEEDITFSKLTGDAIGACNAGNYMGENKIVEGRIVDTYKSQTNTVFLNFEKPYPNSCFTAVIFSSDLIHFPENPHLYYEGKLARIQGTIEEYEGSPEIILETRSQIDIGE